MIIIPERYEDLNLNSTKKRLLLNLKNLLSDEYYMFLEVNPIGGQMIIPFVIMNKEKGLMCITIDEIVNENFDSYIQVMRNIWLQQETLLRNKLLKERILKDDKGNLKFNFNWIYYFTNMNKSVKSHANNTFYENQCWFKDDLSFDLSFNEFINLYFNSSISECSLQDVNLNDDEFSNLGYTIAPHCYIPRHAILTKNETESTITTLNNRNVTLGERYVKAMMLDAEQINLVNNFVAGHQLMLACAGSGKSALLISKAFKLASNNPDKEILITCFNTNLAQYYRWQIDVAGYSERNVECSTFDSFCRHLLIKNEIKIPYSQSSPTYYHDIFKLAERNLSEGNISNRFDAIFIDEIQIFKREWYIFCFNLLRDKEPDNHMFVICGDKSQNVNNNIEKGIAPWQVQTQGFPTFETNTIRIETNYRNCIEVNNFINHFVSLAKKYFKEFNIGIEEQDDLFLRGQAKRHGLNPQILITDRNKEVEKIFEIIEELNNKHRVPYSEIAIIIPQRQYITIKYFILQWLKDAFNERYLDRTLLLNDESEYTPYGERKGVCICTVESALGLDFQAVIMCGLLPMGMYEKSDKYDNLKMINISEEEMLIRKQGFFKNMNQLYTGMTRARDHLYVLLSNKNSIYSDILLETMDRMGLS